MDASVAGAVAEQQARLAEVSRLVAAHAVRKANDLAETRRHTAALQTQLTALAECAREATDATAAVSEAGLQVRRRTCCVVCEPICPAQTGQHH